MQKPNLYRYLLFIYCFLYLPTFASAQNEDGSWKFSKYYETKNPQGKTMLVLSNSIFKKDKSYDGRVKWKIQNVSDIILCGLSIGSREYELKSGKIVEFSALRTSNCLTPGNTKYFEPDIVNVSENTGWWSDRNNNPVVQIKFWGPIIGYELQDKKNESQLKVTSNNNKKRVMPEVVSKTEAFEILFFMFNDKSLNVEKITYEQRKMAAIIAEELVQGSCAMNYYESLLPALRPRPPFAKIIINLANSYIKDCPDKVKEGKIYNAVKNTLKTKWKSVFNISKSNDEHEYRPEN